MKSLLRRFCAVSRNSIKFLLTVTHSISMMYDGPLVVVLGATGTGKSKLALDIAKELNGEIISADSMQVYQGLDIVSNKVSAEERAICKHHLIGFLPPLEEYTITDFQKHALKAIQDIQSRKKLPVICGGTVYYIESILWEFLLPTNRSAVHNSDALVRSDVIWKEMRDELEEKSSEQLHQILKEIDPERAARLHPNDRRKVVRSIEVFYQSGLKHSHLLKSQNGDRRVGGPLLFKNTCLIWIGCDHEVLRCRLDKRVDEMVKNGLLDELKNFHENWNQLRLQQSLPDYERGIFQSIGFKEFHRYLTMEDETGRENILKASIERMKLSTWQYAKYQMKWLRKRVVNRIESLPVYAVNSTNLEAWYEEALFPSLKILKSSLVWGNWVSGISCSSEIFLAKPVTEAKSLQPIPRTTEVSDTSPLNQRSCQVCDGKIFLSDDQWEMHTKSKRHKRAERGRTRRLGRTIEILSRHVESPVEKDKVDEDVGADISRIFETH